MSACVGACVAVCWCVYGSVRVCGCVLVWMRVSVDSCV